MTFPVNKTKLKTVHKAYLTLKFTKKYKNCKNGINKTKTEIYNKFERA